MARRTRSRNFDNRFVKRRVDVLALGCCDTMSRLHSVYEYDVELGSTKHTVSLDKVRYMRKI